MKLQKQVTIFISLFTLLFLYYPGYSQNNIEWTGAWQYGPSDAIYLDTENDVAYLGTGGAVMTVDVSDPLNPSLINDDIRTAGFVRDIWYADHKLYLACGRGGLEIWDVTNSNAPLMMSRTDILYADEPTPVQEIELYNDIAVLMCDWGYVHTVDISDPYNPAQLHFNGQMGNPAHHIHVDENGTIHSTGAQYYVRFNIGPGGTLNNTGAKEFLTGAGNLFGRQNEAFVQFDGNLYILDLTLPGFPAWSITDVLFSDIVVRQDTAFLVNENGFEIWNVTNVQSPQLIGSVSFSYGNEIFMDGKYAYVSSDHEGLRIIDISDPTDPVLMGQLKTLGWTANFDKAGDLGYVANATGLYIVSLADPNGAGPELMGTLPTMGQTNDVVVIDNIAFVADWTGGFRVVDVTDPENLNELSNVPIQAWKIDAEGNFVYVAETNPNQPDTLKIYDVSNLSSPVLTSQYTLPESAWDIEYNNGYVYIANFNSGLRIIDVSDPYAPIEASYIDLPWVLDVDIEGNLAFIAAADWDGGLVSADISDPENPQILQIYNPSGWFHPFHASVSGSYAYASDIYGEIYVFDVSDPSNMTELESINLPGDILNIMAVNEYIYVADGQTGLQILSNGLYTGIPSQERFSTTGFSNVVAYPNPSSGRVTLNLGLSEKGLTSIDVFDISGRKIINLVNQELEKGNHLLYWKGRNESGNEVPAGTYFYRITSPTLNKTGKIIVQH